MGLDDGAGKAGSCGGDTVLVAVLVGFGNGSRDGTIVNANHVGAGKGTYDGHGNGQSGVDNLVKGHEV